MGSSGSRVIQIDDLENRLQECVRIKDANSDIYGEVHYVSFQGMPFYLGESQTSEIPHPMSLHYLVKPNLLLFPQFTLLQDIGPDDFYQLLSIIKGISQMVIQGGQVGFGKNRIGYNARWGVVGQKNVYWPYYQILVQNNPEGVFLSPQLMIALSQQKQTPKVNFQKADIFAFGIMLIQIIFQQKLDHIYDFQNFQIYLNPLLEKITMVKANFGEQFAQILVSMLQIQQENRLNFSELLENIQQLMSEYSRNMIGSNNSQRAALQYSRGNNRTPTKGPSIYSQKTPKNNGGNYRNDVSPFRGRFGSNVRPNQRSGRTPERVNKSPMRKDLRINTKLDKQNNQYNARIGFTDYGKAARLSPLMRR